MLQHDIIIINVTVFEKLSLMAHLEIFRKTCLYNSILRRKEAAYPTFSAYLQLFKVLQWTNTCSYSWLNYQPFQIRSLFSRLIDTTSTPIGVVGGGQWVTMEWQEVPIKKINGSNCINQGYFELHISQNVTKLSLTNHVVISSHVVILSQLPTWSGKMHPFKTIQALVDV